MMKGVNLRFTATNAATPAMKSVQNQLVATKGALNATAVAGRKFSQSLGGSTWRRQVQQAGMQISDFSVQVAGGQSAILAFTQNAPQFLQNFGAMGGVIAAAVTILGTFAFMASKSAGAFKEFSKQIEETSGKIEEYIALLKSAGEVRGLGAAMRDVEQTALATSSVLDDLIGIQRLEAFESVQALSDSLVDSVKSASWFKTEIADIGRIISATTGEIISANMGGRLGEGVREFSDALDALGEASTIQEQYDAASNLRDMFSNLVGPWESMDAEQRKFYRSLLETIQKTELLGAVERATAQDVAEAIHARMTGLQAAHRQVLAQTGAERAARSNLEYHVAMLQRQMAEQRAIREAAAQAAEAAAIHARMTGIQAAHQAYLKHVSDTQAGLQAELEMRQLITTHGENSWRVAVARLATERDIFFATAAVSNATGEVRAQLIGAWGAARGIVGVISAISGELSVAVGWARNLWNMLGGVLGRMSAIGRLVPSLDAAGSALGRVGNFLGGVLSDGATAAANGLSEVTDNLAQLWNMATSGASMNQLQTTLDGFTPTEPSGGGGATVTKEATAWEKALEKITAGVKSFSDSLAEAGVNSKSLAETFSNALKKMASNLISSGLQKLIMNTFAPMFQSMGSGGWGNIGKVLIGGLFPGIPSFEGGGATWRGPRVGGLDGRGGRLAMLHSNESVTDHTNGGGGNGGGAIRVYVDDEMKLRAVFEQATNSKMAGMNKAMPDRVRQINSDPYRKY